MPRLPTPIPMRSIGEQLLNVPAAGVLGNDTDPEGDPLAGDRGISAVTRNVDLDSNGSFTYTHDGSATTSDSFTYKASDGEFDSAPVTVSIAVNGSDPLAVNVEGAIDRSHRTRLHVLRDRLRWRRYYVLLAWRAKLDGAVVRLRWRRRSSLSRLTMRAHTASN